MDRYSLFKAEESIRLLLGMLSSMWLLVRFLFMLKTTGITTS